MQSDILAPQVVSSINQSILNKYIVIFEFLIGINRFDNFVVNDHLIDFLVLCLIRSHDIGKQLLDIPVKGRSKVHVKIKGKQGTIDATV